MQIRLNKRLVLPIFSAGILIFSQAGHAVKFAATRLEVPVGAAGITAFAINNDGQIVGSVDYPEPIDPSIPVTTTRAIMWQTASTSTYELLDANSEVNAAFGINNNGQVVGAYIGTGEGPGLLWQPHSTTPTLLNWLVGYSGSWARGINDKGEIVGHLAGYQSSMDDHAALWHTDSTTPIELGTLGGSGSNAAGINNNSQVVGSAYTSNGNLHATLWQTGLSMPIDLGTLGGRSSWADAINNNGDMVGTSYTSDGTIHASLWLAGSTTAVDLGTLGSNNSYAYDINDNGQVVGQTDTAAILWQAGSTTAIDLNTLVTLTDSRLTRAYGINDKGQIIANDSSGFAYLLTPVPPPSAIWLFSSALAGVIGFNRRKRS